MLPAAVPHLRPLPRDARDAVLGRHATCSWATRRSRRWPARCRRCAPPGSSASRGAGSSCASAACARGEDGGAALAAVAGGRLRWGLSAAGHLDPAVFRFFQRHGVELCSGFGMTEAAGGITMTPPGEYEDGSVGVPLPGIRARLSPIGELEIAGPYVGRYLDDPAAGPGRAALAGDGRHLRAPAGRALRDRRPRQGRLQEHARADRRAGRGGAPAERRARREARVPGRRRARPQRAADRAGPLRPG